MRNKKGQSMGGLENAPTIIMIVGLLFLTMATIAFIGDRYGNALDTDNTAYSAVNETLTTVDSLGEYLDLSAFENAVCSVVAVTNATNGVTIPATNYTATNCLLQAVQGDTTFNNTNWNVTYTGTFSHQTVASNTTTSLETEIGNNTSIAGIVLTISLIGIVLTILISVFMGFSRRTDRV